MKFLPFVLIATSLGSLSLEAQNPPAPTNLVTNGGFERFSAQDNLWDGVSADGYLEGRRVGVDALAESGTFRTMAMPISVSAGDMNGDGLVDIVTADPYGYMQVYFNSGTKTAPVFTHGEAISVFLSAAPGDIRKAPRINLFDWSRRGMLDLMVGNYTGELLFIPNTGSATAPEFRQPQDVAKSIVSTTKSGELWANLTAPAAYDFNKDGKVDIALGEGSYSANSIHLLVNQGTNNAPKFDEANRFYLAYGDGREHLTPTVADYNGDGEMDILASNREGKVGVYLNPGPLWKPGAEFKFSTDIKFGAADSLGGLVTIFAVDMNGDGLFDILIGRANGRISLATNTGTKTEPKFDAPVDLKGTDIWGRNMRAPSGWSVDVGVERGNFNAAATCFTDADEPGLAPPEGKSALKIGYFLSPNKVMKVPAVVVPGNATVQTLFMNSLEFDTVKMPGNTFVIRKPLPELKIGSSYILSFKSKGVSVSGLKWTLGWRGFKKLAQDKIEVGDRNSQKVTKFEVHEEKEATGTPGIGGTWTASNKTFTVEKFREKNLSDLVKVPAVLEFRGTLTPNTGAFYLDDVQLVEKP